jgi:hypothetical protein
MRRGAELRQGAPGDAFLELDQAEQYVLAADAAMAEGLGVRPRQLKSMLGARVTPRLSHARGAAAPMTSSIRSATAR